MLCFDNVVYIISDMQSDNITIICYIKLY